MNTPRIPDGICDDACRYEGCSFDGEDCESGCIAIDDVCSLAYSIWEFFSNGLKHDVDHHSICSELIPVAITHWGERLEY